MGLLGEGRHAPGPSPDWAERWGFEAVTPELALFVDVIALPNQGRAWFWAAVVGAGRRYVLCRDDELVLRARAWPLELRGTGIWMHAICEDPWRHWTVAMEAFAVRFEDRTEAWRSERGDLVGLAFDLEWESDEATAYPASCRVTGTLQVGDEQWDVDTAGRRDHRWGELRDVLDVEAAPLSTDDDRTAPLLAELPGGTGRILRWVDGDRWRTAAVDATVPA